jgi:integrase
VLTDFDAQLGAERETDGLAASRDRAIMQLLLRTGLRIGELAALEVWDVRLTQRIGELAVRHGRGDRRRVAPLTRSARAALREWLVDRTLHPSRPSGQVGALWLSRTGQPLSVRSINKLVAQIMAAARVEESDHALRHTLATRLVRDQARTSHWSPNGSVVMPSIRSRRSSSDGGSDTPFPSQTGRRHSTPGSARRQPENQCSGRTPPPRPRRL